MPTTTGNGVALAAHEAIIQTASVNIQTLRVGKKQVTMGLFRQLPRDILLDPQTLQLRGVPWGHVNYWWDGDGSGSVYHTQASSAKLHVVWQLGDTLKRAIVHEAPDGATMYDFQDRLQMALDNWVLAQLPLTQACEFVDGFPYQVRLDGRLYRVFLPDREELSVVRMYCLYRTTPENAGQAYSRAKAYDAYDALVAARDLTSLTPPMLRERAMAIEREQEAYKRQWAKQWQVLSALPQLFIAV
jgi:hypothetical protein